MAAAGTRVDPVSARRQASSAPVAYETTLMLDEQRREIIPLSTFAFEHAQGGMETVRAKNLGNLILFRDGTLRRIEEITVVGPDGDGFVWRALSYLTRSWRVRTTLSEAVSIRLDDLKNRIAELVGQDAQRPEPYLDHIPRDAEVARLVGECKSIDELFDQLRVPSPEDALDILC